MLNKHEKEIEARAKASTPGPWKNVRPGGVPPGIVCDIGGEGWDITEEGNFIAHAREDIPYLLETIAALREPCADERNCCERCARVGR